MQTTRFGKRTLKEVDLASLAGANKRIKGSSRLFDDEETLSKNILHESHKENLPSMAMGDKLGLVSPPITPTKQRIKDYGVGDGVLSTPPSTPAKKVSIYQRAKSLFQRSYAIKGVDLVGREEEAVYLNQFLAENIVNCTSDSVYVSGPPGTGKTAQISQCLNTLQQKKTGRFNVYAHSKRRVGIARVNCMTLKTPDSIFSEIFHQLRGELSIFSSSSKKTYDDLYSLLSDSTFADVSVVLLDEMDHLVTKDQQVLFQLFHMAASSTTKLVLIGIANALDMTDKLLPRLKTNGLNPKKLQFLPYNGDQIRRIIVTRLKSLNDETDQVSVPIIHPAAIQLCCKKSASNTGDLRKAFDICYRAIEMVETDYKKRMSCEVESVSSAPKVLISHIAKVCSQSFGDNSSTKLRNLNLLQKAVLCCLFNYQVRNVIVQDQLTINTLYDYYLSKSSKDKLLGKLKLGEFLEIVSTLESNSVVNIVGGRGLKSVDVGMKRIKANVSYEDMERCVGEVGVLRGLLFERV